MLNGENKTGILSNNVGYIDFIDSNIKYLAFYFWTFCKVAFGVLVNGKEVKLNDQKSIYGSQWDAQDPRKYRM